MRTEKKGESNSNRRKDQFRFGHECTLNPIFSKQIVKKIYKSLVQLLLHCTDAMSSERATWTCSFPGFPQGMDYCIPASGCMEGWGPRGWAQRGRAAGAGVEAVIEDDLVQLANILCITVSWLYPWMPRR